MYVCVQRPHLQPHLLLTPEESMDDRLGAGASTHSPTRWPHKNWPAWSYTITRGKKYLSTGWNLKVAGFPNPASSQIIETRPRSFRHNNWAAIPNPLCYLSHFPDIHPVLLVFCLPLACSAPCVSLTSPLVIPPHVWPHSDLLLPPSDLGPSPGLLPASWQTPSALLFSLDWKSSLPISSAHHWLFSPLVTNQRELGIIVYTTLILEILWYSRQCCVLHRNQHLNTQSTRPSSNISLCFSESYQVRGTGPQQSSQRQEQTHPPQH